MLSDRVIAIDACASAQVLAEFIRRQVLGTLRRRGVVLGVSGGVDSAVCAGLCARALGAERVLGLLMPEHEFGSESLALGRSVVEAFGIRSLVEPIAPALEAVGCYGRQNAAIRLVFPDVGDGCRSKLVSPPVAGPESLDVMQLVVETAPGGRRSSRMPPGAYRQLVAATNFKQRLRKTLEYYHADRLGYAVVGTPNRLEYDQGFFVKQGDGAADLKPIARLYKTQVYALAEHLGVPERVRAQAPTTDTFTLPQTQEEFFFGLPYRAMDLCLYGKDHGLAAEEVAQAAGLSAGQVARVYRQIEARRRAATYLHAPPLLPEATPCAGSPAS